jgi:hypothetical protein
MSLREQAHRCAKNDFRWSAHAMLFYRTVQDSQCGGRSHRGIDDGGLRAAHVPVATVFERG